MASPPSTRPDVPDDAELLARVAEGEVDPGAASRAQAELYARHVRYLYGVLSRQHKLLALAGTSAEDLVQDTFHRAFERASTFTTDGIADPERLRRRTRAWLGRIAQRLLMDQLARDREVSASPFVERAADDSPEPAASGPNESPALVRIREALEKLPEREQDVLRASALYYRADGAQRLPNAVSEELAARWSTTNDNIRAIRSRAMKKLRNLLGTSDSRPREVT